MAHSASTCAMRMKPALVDLPEGGSTLLLYTSPYCTKKSRRLSSVEFAGRPVTYRVNCGMSALLFPLPCVGTSCMECGSSVGPDPGLIATGCCRPCGMFPFRVSRKYLASSALPHSSSHDCEAWAGCTTSATCRHPFAAHVSSCPEHPRCSLPSRYEFDRDNCCLSFPGVYKRGSKRIGQDSGVYCIVSYRLLSVASRGQATTKSQLA